MASVPIQLLKPMPSTAIKPSSRLLRAAAAERADIARQRERLRARREDLATQLGEIEASLATLDEHEALLGRLAPLAEQTSSPQAGLSTDLTGEQMAAAPIPPQARDDPADSPNRTLRGPAIRQTAVSVLLAQGHADALHYRAWYELLVSAGYRVAGKDPLAVFLTQLGRSPVVRKSTKAGVYELDRNAPHRLASQLAALKASLMQAAGGSATTDLGEIRDRRETLLNGTRHTERALEEAERMLGSGAGGTVPDLRAVG